MKQQTQPLLSVAMIFKNEIRCLERCMKSLQPLREAIPCELVMADTGSDDGSREVAEKYADLVFDFPWINDFSAARNAVLDRCKGKWALVLDADEWLKGDPSDLLRFVRDEKGDFIGALMARNYTSTDLETGSYSDFTTIRVVRMSSGIRYVNAIHERWDRDELNIYLIDGLTIHHDGYVAGLTWDEKKRKRNMDALRKKLAANPEDLQTLEQCIESGSGTPEYLDYIRRARAGVLAKAHGWKNLGASIYRHAVVVASASKLPETEDWIQEAHELFPNSIYTNIDIACVEFGRRWAEDDYDACVRLGECYFRALEDYDAKRYELTETLFNSLAYASDNNRQRMRLFLADAYRWTNRPQKCLAELEKVKITGLDAANTDILARIIIPLHGKSDVDTSTLVRRVWDELGEPVPTEQQAQVRRAQFIRTAASVFPMAYQENEKKNEKFCRHAYTAFLPLEGMCPLGDAAILMELKDRETMAEKLKRVEDLEQLPVAALDWVLSQGVPFPDRRLSMDQMDTLASRLAGSEGFREVLRQAVPGMTENLQKLTWTRGLVLAGVRSFGWKETAWGLELARYFAQVEGAFLPQCYMPQFLQAEHTELLPSMHRFGWYCVQAFARLDAGDLTGYVRLLREGLVSCPAVSPMVDFLSDHISEIQALPPSEELRALAEQVRALLSAYSPDDPAVAALKASPIYQKVARFIER